MKIPIGTRTLLWGSHQFLIHPLFVALAWRKLYKSWPNDWRIFLAIALHDIGYWGLGDLDGPVGELHPMGGARIVAWLASWRNRDTYHWWYEFTACHSRTYARRVFGGKHSPLMNADKLAIVLYPHWLYSLLAWLTGEWQEGRDRWIATGEYPGGPDDGARVFCRHLQENLSRFHSLDAYAGGLFIGK